MLLLQSKKISAMRLTIWISKKLRKQMDRKSRKFFVNLRDFPTFKIEVQFWEYEKVSLCAGL